MGAGITLVCGGRDFHDMTTLRMVLDEVSPEKIVHGAAKGADSMAGRYARERGITCREFPVTWRRNGVYNPRAAFDRNQQMLDEGQPDLVVAFPGGGGTRDMVSRARKDGFTVWTVTESGKILR